VTGAIAGLGRRSRGGDGGGGARCWATGDAEKREGGEQQVRFREAEAGVHFIGPRRRWGGGEAAGGGGVLPLVGFKGVRGGRGDGTTPIQWGK
jgi:hypothetical protein